MQGLISIDLSGIGRFGASAGELQQALRRVDMGIADVSADLRDLARPVTMPDMGQFAEDPARAAAAMREYVARTQDAANIEARHVALQQELLNLQAARLALATELAAVNRTNVAAGVLRGLGLTERFPEQRGGAGRRTAGPRGTSDAAPAPDRSGGQLATSI
jgi:hypothetical protein